MVFWSDAVKAHVVKSSFFSSGPDELDMNEIVIDDFNGVSLLIGKTESFLISLPSLIQNCGGRPIWVCLPYDRSAPGSLSELPNRIVLQPSDRCKIF